MISPSARFPPCGISLPITPRFPEDSLIQAALPLVDYQDVVLDGQELTFQKEGMQLDLGAIAKLYVYLLTG